MTDPGLLRAVDCVQVPVPDLDAGLAFYRDRLGHRLLWRTAEAAGLGLPGGDTELVLTTTRGPEVDFLVSSVPEAVAAVVAAGGTVVVAPVEIPVGRVAVVADPFGTRLTLLDLSKGRYVTEPDGTVTGVRPEGAGSAEGAGGGRPEGAGSGAGAGGARPEGAGSAEGAGGGRPEASQG